MFTMHSGFITCCVLHSVAEHVIFLAGNFQISNNQQDLIYKVGNAVIQCYTYNCLMRGYTPIGNVKVCYILYIAGDYPIPHRIHGAGIYANIGGIVMVNVTIYGIHGSYRYRYNIT